MRGKQMEKETKKIGSGYHKLLSKNLDIEITPDFIKDAGFKQGEVLAIDIISPKTIVITKEYDECLVDEMKNMEFEIDL